MTQTAEEYEDYLFERMHKAIKETPETINGSWGALISDMAENCTKVALDEYAASQPRQEWVSVDERLPETNNYELFPVRNKEGKVFVAHWDKDKWMYDVSYLSFGDVVEWLSTAPQEVKQIK